MDKKLDRNPWAYKPETIEEFMDWLNKNEHKAYQMDVVDLAKRVQEKNQYRTLLKLDDHMDHYGIYQVNIWREILTEFKNRNR